MSKPKDVAMLFWGENTLWLGPWKVAQLTPVWRGAKRDCSPDMWRAEVGYAWKDDRVPTYESALDRSEHVTMGQLRSLGIRAAEFQRPDGSTRKPEMP